jgi:uncharacterized membrane protein YdfJ with MMPL/SSD domain
MIVSFVGLLVPKTIVLNQYGFSLLVGVAIDTFAMRPIVVPATFAVAGSFVRVNWWPRQMPDVLLSWEEEEAALLAGLEVPPPRLVTAPKPTTEELIINEIKST